MAIFSYTATTMEGIMVEGVIEATQDVILISLRILVLYLLRLLLQSKVLAKDLQWRSSKADLLTFTTELSVLLNAGFAP